MGRDGSAGSGKLEPAIRVAGPVRIESRAPVGRFRKMTSDEFCIGIGEQRCDSNIKLLRNIFSSGWNTMERRIVFVKELVIETLTHNFPGALLDFADVDKHSVAWIDWPGENKVRHVITASAVMRPGFRTKSGEIFPVAPMLDLQAPRCRELETFADRQQHEAANTLEMVSQMAPAILWSARTCPRFEQWRQFATRQFLKIVGHMNAVDLEALHRIHKCGRGVACKPRRRTPFIIFRQRNNAVSRRIMMNVIQSSQIRALECDAALPKLKPHFSFGRVIPEI